MRTCFQRKAGRRPQRRVCKNLLQNLSKQSQAALSYSLNFLCRALRLDTCVTYPNNNTPRIDLNYKAYLDFHWDLPICWSLQSFQLLQDHEAAQAIVGWLPLTPFQNSSSQSRSEQKGFLRTLDCFIMRVKNKTILRSVCLKMKIIVSAIFTRNSSLTVKSCCSSFFQTQPC